MSVDTDQQQVGQGIGPMGRILTAATVGCLVAAGLVLWASRGDAVFNDMVVAALAWCF